MFIVDYVTTNWELISGAFIAGYAFAVAIAKLTPTKADDDFLASLYEKFGVVLKFLPLPGATPVAKAVVVADKAASVAEQAAVKAADAVAAKAATVDKAKG